MQKNIYLSGAISSLPRSVAKANFEYYKKQLEAQGYNVINPFEDVAEYIRDRAEYEDDAPDDLKMNLSIDRWEDCMRVALFYLLNLAAGEHVSEIAMMPNWRGSKGALVEFAIAKLVGIPYRELPFKQGGYTPPEPEKERGIIITHKDRTVVFPKISYEQRQREIKEIMEAADRRASEVADLKALIWSLNQHTCKHPDIYTVGGTDICRLCGKPI